MQDIQTGEFFRQPASRREVTLVLGMHRSGTSLLANILHILGIEMMNQKPHASSKNPSGFWEREDLMAVQDDILAALGVPIGSAAHSLPLPEGWWQQAAIRPLKAKLGDLVAAHLDRVKGPWGFKDPRTCRLLPLWADILAELDVSPRIVWAVRHPSEAANSMADKQPGVRPMSAAQSEVMWLAYNYDILRYAGRNRPVIVPYDAWFADALGTARALADRLGLAWPGSDSEVGSALHALINPDWRHQWAARDRAATLLPLSEDTYQGLLGLARAGADDALVERLVQPMQSLFGAIAPFAAEVRTMREEQLDPALRDRDYWRTVAENLQAKLLGAGQQLSETEAEAGRIRAELESAQRDIERYRADAISLRAPEAHGAREDARLRAEVEALREALRSERERFAEATS